MLLLSPRAFGICRGITEVLEREDTETDLPGLEADLTEPSRTACNPQTPEQEIRVHCYKQLRLERGLSWQQGAGAVLRKGSVFLSSSS